MCEPVLFHGKHFQCIYNSENTFRRKYYHLCYTNSLFNYMFFLSLFSFLISIAIFCEARPQFLHSTCTWQNTPYYQAPEPVLKHLSLLSEPNCHTGKLNNVIGWKCSVKSCASKVSTMYVRIATLICLNCVACTSSTVLSLLYMQCHPPPLLTAGL